MTQNVPDAGGRLTRREISEAVGDLGWRYVLGLLRASVPVTSLAQAADVAARVVAAAGDDGDGSLALDARRDRLVLSLQSSATGLVTPLEIGLARRISAVAGQLGLRTDAGVGGRESRSDQVLEIAIDALDIAAVRPFWKAMMGYADEAGACGAEDPIIDPVGQGPAIWFQQMDAPRPQRNRIHIDISVPHDEAPHRIAAALAAGGVLLSDVEAPAFWVLADVEGNEACVTTWQGRD
ncbi:VOC family protein [Streptosporangium roseum]|uniref:VOC family protein n=1 Tax=Streptosporangium roseum TaxID=2001 RepID=UPI0004CCAF87|nr:VOC family protein [Streptosporangium roseum]